MKATGTVIEVKDGYAVVKSERHSACDGCHSKDFCLSCSKKDITVTALDPIGVRPGDEVEIETPSRTVLSYAAAVFVLPIFAAIAAYLLGEGIAGEGSYLPYICATGAFAVSIGVVCAVFNTRRMKDRNPLEIVKIINKDIDNESMGDHPRP